MLNIIRKLFAKKVINYSYEGVVTTVKVLDDYESNMIALIGEDAYNDMVLNVIY